MQSYLNHIRHKENLFHAVLVYSDNHLSKRNKTVLRYNWYVYPIGLWYEICTICNMEHTCWLLQMSLSLRMYIHFPNTVCFDASLLSPSDWPLYPMRTCP